YNNTTTWDNKFQQATMIKADGFVYMYGQPNGRRGDVYLARVPENLLLDINAYRYWNGSSWSASQGDAQPVFVGVTGELSVAYNTHFKKFFLTYTNEHRW